MQHMEEIASLDRARREALEALKTAPSQEQLWECLRLFAGDPFKTAKGLQFTYTLRGNELFVSRREKSITRATVNYAYERVLAGGIVFDGPKKLNCFGASYLYPIFRRMGVITLPLEDVKN